MQQLTVGVVGGGAAGMMAAIEAAGQGAKVTIFEGGERVGKKILSTGNGKCNLGNLDMQMEYYYGGDRAFVEQVINRFDTQATISFFESIGLMIKEKNGYLYPLSEQASSVLDVLRTKLHSMNVQVINNCKIESVSVRSKGGFILTAGEQKYTCDRVILACGSKAAPKTGSDGSGYQLAKNLGHEIVKVVPALVALRCTEGFFKEIAGVRADAEITVEGPGETIIERGELQLTDYGISGIPVFQLSRKVNYLLKSLKCDMVAKIDFLPDFSGDQLEELFDHRLKQLPNVTVEEFFTGMLNKKLMLLFMKLAGLKREDAVSVVKESKLRKVLALCKCLEVTITGSNAFEQAQVCAGGVDTAQIHPDTMESKLVPGLYFAGEMIDVDGRCGGYNLQWAWASGYLAGHAQMDDI